MFIVLGSITSLKWLGSTYDYYLYNISIYLENIETSKL
jgi:hypothetical protein